MSYCTGCGRPHDGECGRLTLPERLDAAETAIAQADATLIEAFTKVIAGE